MPSMETKSIEGAIWLRPVVRQIKRLHLGQSESYVRRVRRGKQ